MLLTSVLPSLCVPRVTSCQGPAATAAKRLGRQGSVRLRAENEDGVSTSALAAARQSVEDLAAARTFEAVAAAAEAAAAAAALALDALQLDAEVAEAFGKQVRARLALAAGLLESAESEAHAADESDEDDLTSDEARRPGEEGGEAAKQARYQRVLAAALAAQALLPAPSEAAKTAAVAKEACLAEAQRAEAWVASQRAAIADGCADFDTKFLRAQVAKRRFEKLRPPAVPVEPGSPVATAAPVGAGAEEPPSPSTPTLASRRASDSARKSRESETTVRLQERLARDSRDIGH